MEHKKKQMARITVSIFTLSLLLLSVTYAFLNMELTGSKRQVIISGKVDLELFETNAITLENALPMYDEVGMLQTPFAFTLTNKGEEIISYTLKLIDITEEGKEKLPTNIVKYGLTKDGKQQIHYLSSISNQILDQGRIKAHQMIDYKLRLWIDSKIEDETIIKGKTLSYRIDMEAHTIADTYKETVLNGADPVLTNNLIPITIADDGTARKADLKDAWYNYTNKEWANAVVLKDATKEYKNEDIIPEENIQSYFVWIPRYKYKIFNEGNYEDVSAELANDAIQTIEIEFESKEVAPSTGTIKEEWLSHPAFQAFDTNGLWVGKFETGYNENNKDVDPIIIKNILIKPNIPSWKNLNVKETFKLGYEYLRKEESHMMKNTEWGAVAYLQHSKYGSATSVRVNNNYGKTGYAAAIEPSVGSNGGTSIPENLTGSEPPESYPYNTEIGYTASTTGNITGIYDMAGGAYEYVMGYNKNSYRKGGISELEKLYSDFFENPEWNKYYDRYGKDSGNEPVYQDGIMGDATKEMGPFANLLNPDNTERPRSSWHGDLATNLTNDNSWILRGGSWQDGIESGIFAFSNTNGGAYAWNSFRIVLAPNK